MLSWFKKLFQVFKSEEDEYIDEARFEEQHQNRDVDAKVLYQYPKGQFRFPLIPDEKEEPRARRTEKRVSQKESPEPIRTRRSQHVKVAETKKTEKSPAPKKNFSNRAFRPTEIPSPIYGYDRQPKSSEPIEYELKNFSSSKKEKIENEKIPDTIDSNKLEEETLPILESKVVDEVLSSKPEIIEEEQEIDWTEIEHVPETTYTAEVATAEETIQQEITVKEEPAFEVVTEIEPEPESELDLEPELEPEPVSELEPEPELEVEPEPEPEKRRSHIPFNVIMLKEDRRKLQERTIAKLEPVKSMSEVSATTEEIVVELEAEEPYYVFPSLDLLKPPVFISADAQWLQLQEEQLNETLFHFNVRASVANVTQGPSVTRFEVHPEPGVKVNKITNLADDIKLSLAAKDIRMEAPIPGTHLIGIEVPNKSSRPVLISEILTTEEFSKSPSPLTAVLGLDISGKPIVTDLRKMPHGLIAGATGSGKSVCINSILVSLLYKANPHEVKLLLIDPKMVELAPYNQIPHLVSPVITDVKAATAALKWAVDEMERRYELFAHAGVREITRFNEVAEKEKNYSVKLPYIVIVIDELADLMMMSPADVEEAICRIAQKARACGIHLIIATQRPSVDVITGLIKANVPTRIAFSVSSQIDSRTIIDISGAERLLGRGDMLFLENGSSKPVRLQGTYVSDEEIDAIVAHVRREQSPQYLFEQEELLKKSIVTEEEDELFYEACEYIIEQGGASTSSLQRRFKIGYNRAARLIDMMEEQGFISEAKGSKPRDVLITESELESIHDQ